MKIYSKRVGEPQLHQLKAEMDPKVMSVVGIENFHHLHKAGYANTKISFSEKEGIIKIMVQENTVRVAHRS